MIGFEELGNDDNFTTAALEFRLKRSGKSSAPLTYRFLTSVQESCRLRVTERQQERRPWWQGHREQAKERATKSLGLDAGKSFAAIKTTWRERVGDNKTTAGTIGTSLYKYMDMTHEIAPFLQE